MQRKQEYFQSNETAKYEIRLFNNLSDVMSASLSLFILK